MQERLFTTGQVADLLGATSREVRQWIDKGWLPRHSGPDGVDRVSETGLIKFLKGRGIDIMQLMVSTAVDQGYRPDVGEGKKSPAEAAPPAPQAELLGEGPSAGPKPEVISASDGPAVSWRTTSAGHRARGRWSVWRGSPVAHRRDRAELLLRQLP